MTLDLLLQIIKERIKDFDGDIYTEHDGDQVAGILRDVLDEYEKRKHQLPPEVERLIAHGYDEVLK